MTEIATTEGRQAFSSVEVTKNTKGYSWAAKVYVPAGEEETAFAKVRELEKQLRDEYGEKDDDTNN